MKLMDEGQIKIHADGPLEMLCYHYYDKSGTLYKVSSLEYCPFGKPIILVEDNANIFSVIWAKITKPGHAIESQYFYDNHIDLFEWRSK